MLGPNFNPFKIIQDLGIDVPEGSAFAKIWHTPFQGTSWAALVDEYEFFNQDRDDNTGNYPTMGKLVKNGAVTIFGLQLVALTHGGTYTQERALFGELIGYGRLELRKGGDIITHLQSCDLYGVLGGARTMGVSHSNPAAEVDAGHVILPPGLTTIPGGIEVQNDDIFNIRQRFTESGAAAAVEALSGGAIDLKYGVQLYVMVHNPQGNNCFGMPLYFKEDFAQ